MTSNALTPRLQALQQRATAWWHTFEETLPGGRGRGSLWLALIALVLALLIVLVWLAGRYETSQLQANLDRDTADAVNDLRRQMVQCPARP
jgi:two-component system sensor histidine kinase DctS